MTQYNAILLDECGDEFSLTVIAKSQEKAIRQLRANYPECSIRYVETFYRERVRESRKYRERMQRYADDTYDLY